MQSTDPPSESATLNEIRDAIIGMTEADTLRIELAARSLAPGAEYEPKELYSEAISRTLDGVGKEDGRHWPKGTPFVAYLIMTMKSIANGSRTSDNQRKTIRVEAITPPGTSAEDVLGGLSCYAEGANPLSMAIASEEAVLASSKVKDVVSALEERFSDDEEVLFLIIGLQEGKSAKETQEIAGMNQREYEAARRRLRRGIANLFPEMRPI